MSRASPPLDCLNSADGWTPEFTRHFFTFYNGIFRPAFPDPNLRESSANLRRNCDPRRFGSREPWGFIQLALMSGNRGTTPVGGLIYEWFRSCNAVLFGYVVIAPAYREQGIARMLLHSAVTGLRERYHIPRGAVPTLFAETEMPPPDPPDPGASATAARYAALDGLGFLALDIDYVQPPLAANKDYVTNLRLMVHRASVPRGARRFSAWRVAAFLRAVYGSVMGPALAEDVRLQAVLAQAEARKDIALLPLITRKDRL